ncbi:hypothetical protein DRH29_05785 [candidate division Kazan bacterium]|uniref:Uncharacterized protein n=1 Tax=candidate division Kazan bacterium TaxID=2202143 RepID=A0A420ZAY1_UNCK3|nr:MAG: hypothetical protein DRH29_05785 [candidate division Kazan bacterium]
MIPNLPFPNLDITTRGNIAEVKLKNQDLADMLKKAVENRGQKVKDVEVYPDAFVIVVDLSDLERTLINQGLKATLEPKEIKITIDRRELINAFATITQLNQKGIEIIDERDYILLRGNIVGIPNISR